jgi:hypothetical protein
MSEREYPRKVWVLMPSFKPVEVTVVEKYGSYSLADYGDVTEKGKLYPVEAMHPTKDAAITSGREKCKALQADIDKRQDTLNKRISALDKAESASKGENSADGGKS